MTMLSSRFIWKTNQGQTLRHWHRSKHPSHIPACQCSPCTSVVLCVPEGRPLGLTVPSPPRVEHHLKQPAASQRACSDRRPSFHPWRSFSSSASETVSPGITIVCGMKWDTRRNRNWDRTKLLKIILSLNVTFKCQGRESAGTSLVEQRWVSSRWSTKKHQERQTRFAATQPTTSCLRVFVCVCAEVQVPGWGNAPLGAQSSTSGSREKCRDASHERQEPRGHGGHPWLHATHTHLSCQGGTHSHTHTDNTLPPCQSKHSFAWKVNNPQPSGHNYIFNTFIHIHCGIIWIFRQTAWQCAVIKGSVWDLVASAGERVEFVYLSFSTVTHVMRFFGFLHRPRPPGCNHDNWVTFIHTYNMCQHNHLFLIYSINLTNVCTHFFPFST